MVRVLTLIHLGVIILDLQFSLFISNISSSVFPHPPCTQFLCCQKKKRKKEREYTKHIKPFISEQHIVFSSRFSCAIFTFWTECYWLYIMLTWIDNKNRKEWLISSFNSLFFSSILWLIFFFSLAIKSCFVII